MKNLIIAILISASTFGQTTQPTLDETISWIEGKLNYYDGSGFVKSQIEVKFDKSTNILKFTTVYYNSKDGSPHQIVIRYIPIKLMNPNNMLIQEGEGTYWLYLYSNDNKRVIKWESWFVDKGDETKTILMEDNLFFRIPADENAKNTDLANRLKKAFSNLIKYCGGTGEKY